MTTAAQVLATARKYLGYVEGGGPDGKSGNITIFWARLDPAMQGQPWCAGFASAVFIEAGMPLPAMGKPYGFVYVPNAMAYAKAHGLWDESGHYSPGDIVCYGNGQHTGIIESDDGKTMAVWEGNTSPDGSSGSQTNGGCVALRHRPHGPWVNGVMKTSRLLAASEAGKPAKPPVVVPTKPVPVKPPVKPAPKPVKPPSMHSVPLTKAVQRAVRVAADGSWGPDTQKAGTAVVTHDTHNTAATHYLQAHVGAVGVGLWGPKSQAAWVATVKRLQAAIGVAADGDWGPKSKAAWASAVARNYGK